MNVERLLLGEPVLMSISDHNDLNVCHNLVVRKTRGCQRGEAILDISNPVQGVG